MTTISRRDLVQAAVGVAAAGALPIGAQGQGSDYIGPLTGVTSGLDGRAFDPVAYALARIDATPRQLGGTVTTFATALDPRIGVAMVSGYLNTFRDSIASVSHCTDNYVPGILNWAEMHDIAGLIAPRPLFIESGEKDNIFPIAASIASFNAVREIYTVFGAADRVEQEVFPEAHSFWGRRGIPFVARHLTGA